MTAFQRGSSTGAPLFGFHAVMRALGFFGLFPRRSNLAALSRTIQSHVLAVAPNYAFKPTAEGLSLRFNLAAGGGLTRRYPSAAMRTPQKILRDIELFRPNDGDWHLLDGLLDELWLIGASTESLPVLFRVFERFPTEDGAGVLWSIVHGIESLPLAYGSLLEESLQRTPSVMGKAMLNRLANSAAAG